MQEVPDSKPPSVAPTEAASRVGTSIAGKWQVDQLIGTGGMATVYAATHRNGKRAALKILHSEFARDPGLRERFLREGKIANVVDHAARVPVFDDDVTELDEPFLVMELLEGETLSTLLYRSGGKLPVDHTLKLFDTVLDLLAACHKAGIVHRDIKPANIFITHAGQVKVLDFGVARMRDSEFVNATKAGTALGTPAFMSPEQALGVADGIDGRADLFSVGACMYTALSGERLHKAKTDNHALVLAATKAAPSLARVAPDVPVEVVAFVDKALAHDRNRRHQDAATMRQELLAILAGIRSGQIAPPRARKARGVVIRKSDDIVDAGEARTSPEDLAKLVELLHEFWKHTALYMAAMRQYGNHPNSMRALDVAFQSLLDALEFDPYGVRWDVAPYAFIVGQHAIWEPDKAPFDRIPYRLFADGFRKMQVSRGIAQQEFSDFIGLIGSVEAGAAGEDDAVSAFWDRRFEHLAYFAVDSFAEGDAQQRDAFRASCDEVVEQARAFAQIDKSWDIDSTEAAALLENVTAAMREAGEAATDLAVEPLVRATLGAQAAEAPERWNARFVEAFAHGYHDAAARGDVELLTEVLQEWSHDQVTLRNHTLMFGMFDALARAISARGALSTRGSVESLLASVMFPPDDLRTILAHLAQQGTAKDRAQEQGGATTEIVQGVARILQLSDSDSVLQAACDCFQAVRSEPLRAALLDYVSRWVSGHEADLARTLAGADPDLALAIVRMIARTPSRQTMVVIDKALRSPHREVRIEALHQLPNQGPPEQIAPQVESMLVDPEDLVRRDALRLLVKLNATGAVPALMRRVQAPDFHTIPISERREWLASLARLSPVRAEEMLISVLAGKKIIPSENLEQTRAVAADLLQSSSSEAALKAARSAASKWWWNSPMVREVASRAAEAIAARIAAATGQQPAPADDPPESKAGR